MDADGTFVRDGVRVRAAPGNGAGSLEDEYFWDVRTPLADEDARKTVCSLISSRELIDFVMSLPAGRREYRHNPTKG